MLPTKEINTNPYLTMSADRGKVWCGLGFNFVNISFSVVRCFGFFDLHHLSFVLALVLLSVVVVANILFNVNHCFFLCVPYT